jgi:HEAT repeat protein
MSVSHSPTPPARPGLIRRALRWTLPVLVLAVAAGVWQRERLWVWYCAERLERAADGDRGEWADKLAAAGEPAVPTLLGLLRHDDPNVCAAAKGGLDHLTAGWPKDDPRQLAFARQFVEAEPRFSTPGRAAALELLPTVMACGDLDAIQKSKGMVATAARSESVDVRIQAVVAALRPEVDALEAIVPLVGDPDAGVRRAAVLALGPVRDGARTALADDELLRCLHDSDGEVQRLCEMGLRSRGRTPRDIRLGRRYTAPDPAERQKLLIDLADEDDLDLTVWLGRLTADPDPAVRAGAARVAVERRADLGDRLEQMSRSDPDGTVRRIADYYRKKMAVPR